MKVHSPFFFKHFLLLKAIIGLRKRITIYVINFLNAALSKCFIAFLLEYVYFQAPNLQNKCPYSKASFSRERSIVREAGNPFCQFHITKNIQLICHLA